MITPNKRMGSGPLQDYLAVKEAQRRYGVHFLAEVRSSFPLKKRLLVQHPVSHGPASVASCYGCKDGHRKPIANCVLKG